MNILSSSQYESRTDGHYFIVIFTCARALLQHQQRKWGQNIYEVAILGILQISIYKLKRYTSWPTLGHKPLSKTNHTWSLNFMKNTPWKNVFDHQKVCLKHANRCLQCRNYSQKDYQLCLNLLSLLFQKSYQNSSQKQHGFKIFGLLQVPTGEAQRLTKQWSRILQKWSKKILTTLCNDSALSAKEMKLDPGSFCCGADRRCQAKM